MDLHRILEPSAALGLGLYRQGKYVEALEIFDTAIDDNNALNPMLLDNRAATHERMGNSTAALRDARQTIECDERQARGYLRAGRILQAMEKPDVALKLYERGLRLVSSMHPKMEVLQKQHDSLKKRFATPYSRDFLTVLPIELVEMVWSYVPFKQQCICLRVSKTWLAFMTARPVLWADLDLSQAVKPVRMKPLERYIKWSGGKVRGVTLTGVDLHRTKVLEAILRKSPMIEHLSLLSGGLLPTSFAGTMLYARPLKSLLIGNGVRISEHDMRVVMLVCTSLVIARFAAVEAKPVSSQPWPGVWPNLQTFHVHWLVASNIGDLSLAVPPSPNLRQLSVGSSLHSRALLGNVKAWAPCLEELSVRGIHLDEFAAYSTAEYPQLPSTLRSLRLKGVSQTASYWSFSNMLTKKFLTALPLLTEFVSTLNDAMDTYQLLLDILRCDEGLPSPLTKLVCTRMNISQGELITLLRHPRLRKLKTLDLFESMQFDDDIAFTLASTLKSLREINLSRSKITGVGVKRMVQALPQLECLRIAECSGISVDAVEWTRTRGVRVCCN